MAVKGVFTSDSAVQGDAKGDFAAAIMYLYPEGTAQLLGLSSGMESTQATDTLIHWFEENHLSGRTTWAAAITDTTGTSWVLTDASFIIAGAIILCESTGEYMLVTAVSGSTVTVVRGFAGSTAATALISTGVQKIGTAQEEGSARPSAVAQIGYPVFNYCQIFRNAWDVTGTAQAVSYFTGAKLEHNKASAGSQHAEDIERSLWFGRQSLGVQNLKPFRTFSGLDQLITTNVTAAGGTTTYNDVDTWLQGIFAFNIKGKPNERIAFAGNKAVAVINGIALKQSQLQISVGITEFGLNVHRWISPYGNISLMTHPLFNENPVWTKSIRVLHPGAMKTHWLRRTFEDMYDKNGSRAGVDADFGVFTSELSVSYGAEKTGGRLTGLTAAAANP